jgi:thiol-disulfide isomerase/thioredoxin
MRRLAFAAAVLLAGWAAADGVDARGWTSGQKAAGTATVLGAVAPEPVVVTLPKAMAKAIKGPTLLVYFSPTCPHCRHVAAELVELSKRLGDTATVIGVATSGSKPADIEEFRATYKLPFEIVHDTGGAIGSAMGARSTPSAMLVDRVGAELQATGLWYPYSPGTDALVALRVGGGSFAAFERDVYQGNPACFSCHVQEAESWLMTHHGAAWGTLVRKGDDDDPKCTGCHVTGAGQPTGWTPGDDVLTDVGCESCHSAGGPHDGATVDARATCVGCHDAEHSIAFSVEKGLPHIDHFRTNTVTPEAWREVVEAVRGGDAARCSPSPTPPPSAPPPAPRATRPRPRTGRPPATPPRCRPWRSTSAVRGRRVCPLPRDARPPGSARSDVAGLPHRGRGGLRGLPRPRRRARRRGRRQGQHRGPGRLVPRLRHRGRLHVVPHDRLGSAVGPRQGPAQGQARSVRWACVTLVSVPF